MTSYITTLQVRDVGGKVVDPPPGTVLTADGSGGAFWRPVVQTNAKITLRDAAAGENSASLVVTSDGPDMTVRRLLGSNNIGVDQTDNLEVRLVLSSTLNEVRSISGSGKSTLILSEPDVVSVGEARLAWDEQPRSSWRTALTSASLIGFAAGAYAISPDDIKIISENLFATLSDGSTTYSASVGSWIDLAYSGSVFVPGSEKAVGVRNIYLFPHVGDDTPTEPSTCYSSINLPIGTGAIGESNPVPETNVPFEVRSQVYMRPGEKVRLVAVLSGEFVNAPIVTNVCFRAAALPTRKA